MYLLAICSKYHALLKKLYNITFVYVVTFDKMPDICECYLVGCCMFSYLYKIFLSLVLGCY